jgi:hypothetical protein
MQSQVKVIGSNGQISLGKEFAGKMVMVDQLDQGTWIIKAGEFIPDNEKWLYQNGNLEKLEKALQWNETNNPVDNFDELARRIEDGKHQN